MRIILIHSKSNFCFSIWNLGNICIIVGIIISTKIPSSILTKLINEFNDKIIFSHKSSCLFIFNISNPSRTTFILIGSVKEEVSISSYWFNLLLNVMIWMAFSSMAL